VKELTIENFEKTKKPAKTPGVVPPKRGICRRCGLDKPINQLMLCYTCWVIVNIEDRERKEGRDWNPRMPHPEWCRCIKCDRGYSG